MKWRDTPSLAWPGFVQSRLLRDDVAFNSEVLAEVASNRATYYVEFTRFAPKEARDLGYREFLTLDDAKAWAVAMVRLS